MRKIDGNQSKKSAPPPSPLDSTKVNMMNTVTTAKIAFWFRRKILNGL